MKTNNPIPNEYNYHEGYGINFSKIEGSSGTIGLNTEKYKSVEGLYAFTAEELEYGNPARANRIKQEKLLIGKDLSGSFDEFSAKEISEKILSIILSIDKTIEEIKNHPKVKEAYKYDGFGFESYKKAPDSKFPREIISLYDGLHMIRGINVREEIKTALGKAYFSVSRDLSPEALMEQYLNKLNSDLKRTEGVLKNAIERDGDIGFHLSDYNITGLDTPSSDFDADQQKLDQILTEQERDRQELEIKDKIRHDPFFQNLEKQMSEKDDDGEKKNPKK